MGLCFVVASGYENDPAFKSRIHMSLYYPSLSKDIKWDIRDWYIKSGAKLKPHMIVDKKDIKRWARDHYKKLKQEKAVGNGRQIRNAFQTAIALAEYDCFKDKPEIPCH